jgi:hypothetical protein
MKLIGELVEKKLKNFLIKAGERPEASPAPPCAKAYSSSVPFQGTPQETLFVLDSKGEI